MFIVIVTVIIVMRTLVNVSLAPTPNGSFADVVWTRIAHSNVPSWPELSPWTIRSDCKLRHRVADGEIKLKPDVKLAPDGFILDDSHLSACTSCWESDYRHSLHRQPFAPALGEAQLFIDDHALDRYACVVRVMEAPTKRILNVSCPGSCVIPNRGLAHRHAVANHFGMYGTVLRDRHGLWRMWLGEWEPYYTESADGLNWNMLRPLRDLGGKRSRAGNPDWTPRNLCISLDAQHNRLLLGYHCGNYITTESTCLASSDIDDGLTWAPWRGGSHVPRASAQCAQMADCCGVQCQSHADSTNCVNWDPGENSWSLVKREAFGTAAAWREIRGVSVSSNAHIDSDLTAFKLRAKWYFDRLGKSERFQRQIYSLTFSEMPTAERKPRVDRLRLGVMTVIEWPKLNGLAPASSLSHDVMGVYLVPSRDGVHLDLNAVYARNALVPRGSCTQRECAFDNGYLQPASEIVTTTDGHSLYYEGRPVTHERRFSSKATIARAHWPLHRMAAIVHAPKCASGDSIIDTAACEAEQRIALSNCTLIACSQPRPQPRRRSDSHMCGYVITRSFVMMGSWLSLNLNATGANTCNGISQNERPCAGHVLVSVLKGLDAQHMDDRAAIRGFASQECTPIKGDSDAAVVVWRRGASLTSLRGKQVRLRIALCGGVRLYSFTLMSRT